jgi:hypothetical protein
MTIDKSDMGSRVADATIEAETSWPPKQANYFRWNTTPGHSLRA